MLYSIREVLESLIDCNLGRIAYYDHDATYYNDHFTDYESMKHYDGNDEFYANYEPCLIFAGYGDYAGSDLDIANQRYIEENYPKLIESGDIAYQTQGYGYTAMVIYFLRLNVARSGLFDDLEGLDGYPLLDDEINSEVQQELLDEAWENWGKSDFESELEKLTGLDFDNTDWQDNLFWEILRHGTGCEHHPEGTSMYIDFAEVLKDSESIVTLIRENYDNLESGEYELVGNLEITSRKLGLSWSYNGNMTQQDRQHTLDRLSGQKFGSVSELILDTYGLKWHEVWEVVWKCNPINAPLKDALSEGIKYIRPISLPKDTWPNVCYCKNCNDHAVMTVNYGSIPKFINICPDCYNKLMDYWPKCNQCKIKNVNASLQLTLFGDSQDVPLTHCFDCKNSLLAI